jgi:hypothetical protein
LIFPGSALMRLTSCEQKQPDRPFILILNL